MLTADLVVARRRGTELRLVPLDDAGRARVEELASQYLGLARDHIGRCRDELDAAWDAVPVAAQEQRLADGVRKLVSDRLIFSASTDLEPAGLRHALFSAACAVRRSLPVGTPFERAAVIDGVANSRGITSAQLEGALFADLRGAERLLEVSPLSPARLAATFDLAQAQGLLLRAVRVVADVRTADQDPGEIRALFRKLKFLRLLHSITPNGRGGYRVEIDGPFSLFQSVTRYGVQLALALPAITSQAAWRIEADVLWGQNRQPLRFLWTGERAGAVKEDGQATPALADDAAALLEDINDSAGPWLALVAGEVLDLPGVGLCVPDLVLVNKVSNARVFVELMGYWSRDAVWRRVDLVRAGLPHPILFAVGKQLRVSEAALDENLPGALYVYARTPSAKVVINRADALSARAP